MLERRSLQNSKAFWKTAIASFMRCASIATRICACVMASQNYCARQAPRATSAQMNRRCNLKESPPKRAFLRYLITR